MDKKKELAINTAILTIGKICTQFVGFFLLPLYTALLSPKEYGIIDLLNTYVSLIVPIVSVQIDNGLFRFLVDCRGDEIQRKKVFTSVLIFNVALTLAYSLVFAVLYNYINVEYKWYLIFNVDSCIFLNVLLQFCRGIGNNKQYAFSSFLSAIGIIILNILFVVGLHMGAVGMLLGTVLAQVITILYLLFAIRVWKNVDVTLFDFSVLKEVLKFSAPLVPNSVSWWIVSASDRTIISKLISVAANGIYSVANKFSAIFVSIYSVFNLSWTESVAVHVNDIDRDSFISETIKIMLNFFAGMIITTITYIPFVFDLLIAKDYSSAANQVPILLIAVLFQIVVGLYSVIYIALKLTKEIAKSSIIAAAINITINILLVKRMGLYAASVSTLISYLVMAIYRIIHVRKFAKIELNSKALLAWILWLTIALVSFYCFGKILQAGIAVISTVLFLVFNMEMIKSTCNMVRRLIKK